jgi:hypothetical protein
MSIVIGLNLYDGDPGAMRRQAAAADALAALDGVEPVNLQFAHGERTTHAALRTVARLVRDSALVTGAAGRRKPLADECFDVLAAEAVVRSCRHFAFINSDIIVTPALVGDIGRRPHDTYAVSRCDVGGDAPDRMMTAGQDMFVISVRWWQRHRMRFRSYIVGDACWDNVYTAVTMCHSDGVLLNREPLIRHERHGVTWRDASPTARYNGYLAALDSRYFSLWVHYWTRLEALRAAGAPAADEAALATELFVWRRSPADALRQVVRSARAHRHYRRLRAEWTAAAVQA